MYSTTSEALNFIKRVASHATKERRNGRIDAIPLWAQQPTEYFIEYNGKRKQRIINLIAKRVRIFFLRKRIAELRAALDYIEQNQHSWTIEGSEVKTVYHQIWIAWKQLRKENGTRRKNDGFSIRLYTKYKRGYY